MQKIIVLVTLIIIVSPLRAQVGIGTTDPHEHAALHIHDDDNRGILIPSVDKYSDLPIATDNPQAGLLYFIKTEQAFYFRDTVLNRWQCVNPFNTNYSGNTVSNSDSYPEVEFHGTFFGNGTVPVGGIIMWSGTVAPPGWVLCTGGTHTNSRGRPFTIPNLSGRFIIGYASSGTYSNPGNLSSINGVDAGGNQAGSRGGSSTANLEINHLPSHNHSASISELEHQHASGGLTISHSGAHSHEIRGSSGLGGSSKFRRGSSNNNGYVSTRTDNASTNGSHQHWITGSTQFTDINPTISIGNRGNGNSFSIVNPYYVLAFIMRVE